MKELLPQYIDFNTDTAYYGAVYGSLKLDF